MRRLQNIFDKGGNSLNTQELIRKSVGVLDAKKARDIHLIKVDSLTSITDYFLLASATSSTAVKALADELEFKLKEAGTYPKKVEGYNYANWILLDYGDLIVHIFHEETREFYALEKLWSDGELIDISDMVV
jgi:ribosome-associated protein